MPQVHNSVFSVPQTLVVCKQFQVSSFNPDRLRIAKQQLSILELGILKLAFVKGRIAIYMPLPCMGCVYDKFDPLNHHGLYLGKSMHSSTGESFDTAVFLVSIVCHCSGLATVGQFSAPCLSGPPSGQVPLQTTKYYCLLFQ